MPVAKKRILRIAGICVLIFCVLVTVASFIASSKLEKTIQEKLLSIGIHTKSVSISFLKRSVALDSIYYVSPDTLKNPHQLFVQKITASGLHVYSLLKNKELIVGNVVVADGTIRYNKNFRIGKDSSTSRGPKKNIHSITVNHLTLSNLEAAVLNDTITESSVIIRTVDAANLSVSFDQDTTYTVGWIDARLEKIKQSPIKGLHSFAVSALDFNSRGERLEIDSFQVIPNYNKPDFARIAQIQKTRLDITIPTITFEGISLNRLLSDSTLEVSRIRIPGATVHAYRDKRYPFVRDWIMPLPVEGMRRLPVNLKIDSILINNAEIAYEEFSEKGLPQTGTITFNKLDASFANVNTELKQPDKNAFCTLVATCKVMNSGNLHATFKMPLNETVNYEAFGNVRAMDLKSLGPALGNLTRIEISDGTLNDLRFNFSYNDDVSKGEVLINYKDLKLAALKKEKNTHETNKLLTVVINAVIKSDKDKSVDKSKRTGSIDIERDKKRFVFQFWWKSLLDGLQSTFTDNGKKKKGLSQK